MLSKKINTSLGTKLTLKYNDKIEADIPIEALSSKAPIYDRKWKKTKLPQKF